MHGGVRACSRSTASKRLRPPWGLSWAVSTGRLVSTASAHATHRSGMIAMPRKGAPAPTAANDRFDDSRHLRRTLASNGEHPRVAPSPEATAGAGPRRPRASRSHFAHCATGVHSPPPRTDTRRAYVEPVDRRTPVRFCVSSLAPVTARSRRASAIPGTSNVRAAVPSHGPDLSRPHKRGASATGSC
jgi:hypothetical protein